MISAEHILQKRAFRLDNSAELSDSGTWCGGDPLNTQLLNAYTILVPGGERFIIRTTRKYMDSLDPKLREEVERVFFQEASHSREHQRVLDAMRKSGVRLDVFQAATEWFSYTLLEPLTPLSMRLATAAAIEHHNAVIATFFLNQDLLAGIRAGELRRLFVWHFSEEIEHKETVYKVLQSVSHSWLLRAIGLFFSCATFLLFLAIGTALLFLKARFRLTKETQAEQAAPTKAYRGRSGLMVALARESLRYLRPSFHPSVDESRPLLRSALAELERLGIEAPASDGRPVTREMPPRFRTKIARIEDRHRQLQGKYPFFFSSIEKYEGASLRCDGEQKLNFCTYSYLGLLGDSWILAAARKALEQHGTGTHGVRLLGGTLRLHEELESRIAAFFEREAAITFSSGFVTNIAVIGSLVGSGDFVLADELDHASIADGCRLSGAEVIRFRHNDMFDLSATLDTLPDNVRKLIVVDAVYSMDGHIAPIPELIEIRNRRANTILMVDEAHSLGVLGTNGKGIEEHFGCLGEIDVLMGTLSKAIPCQGGYIAGSHDLITHLRYSAQGFVFSAALSPITAAAAKEAFDLIESEGQIRQSRLMSNVRYFMRRLQEEGFDCGESKSAIIPLLLKNETLAFEMAKHCNTEGIYVLPVVYPAVRRGTERLRMNVTYDHRQEDIDHAVCTLVRARAALQGTALGLRASRTKTERSLSDSYAN